MGRCQSQHPLLEILAMIARVAIGDGDDGSFSSSGLGKLSRILAADRERGRIHVNLLGVDTKEPTRAAGYPRKQLGQIVFIQPVQRAS